MIRIGFLGPEGTFSHQAAHCWLGILKEPPYLMEGVTGIPQLFHELEGDRLDQIVVPVENSIEGAVNITQDYLIRSDKLSILGEASLHIEHCLATKEPIKFIEIKAVYSHPQALAQCHHYLQNNLKHAALLQTTSTAEAARIVAEGPPGAAAITSRDGAKKYNLTIQAARIQDFSENKTRFWVLGKETQAMTVALRENCYPKKTSIVVALPYNRPGSLYEVLKEFADRHLDLTRIESRPTKKELGEYLFIIDFLGDRQEPLVLDTLTKLQSKAAMLKVLGSYPVIT